MELISIVLENFRGYHLKHTILIDECLTGIIGKNDAGKSTIFEALDIFLKIQVLRKMIGASLLQKNKILLSHVYLRTSLKV